jgi:hypothetical protein
MEEFQEESEEKGKVRRAPNRITGQKEWIEEIGTDVNGDMIFRFLSNVQETFCNFCQKNYPHSLVFF